MDEEVYIEQPEGYQENAEEATKLACKMNKSIYGLKHASKNWYHRLKNFVVEKIIKKLKVKATAVCMSEKNLKKTIYVLL